MQAQISDSPPSSLRVIAPSLGRRYSGINSSLIAVLPSQSRKIAIAAMGFHLPDGIPRIGIRQFLLGCRSGPERIWHARRNVEMLAGLLLRHVLRYPLLPIFTSAAQRHHSWLTRLCLRRMEAIVATSAAAASFLDRPATVVHHGVDVEEFSPPADREAEWRRRALPGRFGIGVFGRIRQQKGTGDFVDAMIRVLPQRPDWTAVIVGQTTPGFSRFEQGLRDRLSRAGLRERVHFTGFLPDRRSIPEWYRSLSVVVCPSRVEGFGLPCLEAMSSGCPVVATRTGAWPEIVREGLTGHLVPPSDAAALAGAILRVTEDPGRAHAMGIRARQEAVSLHRIEDEAEGIHRVYTQVLSRHGLAV